MVQKYQPVSLKIKDEEYEEFIKRVEKIKDFLGVDSVNSAIVQFIMKSEKILWEAQTYKDMMKIARSYEALYEKEHGWSEREW